VCHAVVDPFADPKVAAAVLIESDGRVLLVRRVNEPFKDCDATCGLVDAGEDPASSQLNAGKQGLKFPSKKSWMLSPVRSTSAVLIS
jgi:hypothetical protein